MSYSDEVQPRHGAGDPDLGPSIAALDERIALLDTMRDEASRRRAVIEAKDAIRTALYAADKGDWDRVSSCASTLLDRAIVLATRRGDR